MPCRLTLQDEIGIELSCYSNRLGKQALFEKCASPQKRDCDPGLFEIQFLNLDVPRRVG